MESLEASGEHAVVELLRVPLADDESVGVEDEEVGDARVRLQRRRQHHGADLDVLQKVQFQITVYIRIRNKVVGKQKSATISNCHYPMIFRKRKSFLGQKTVTVAGLSLYPVSL